MRRLAPYLAVLAILTIGFSLRADLNASGNPVTQSGTWNIGTLTSITNALPAGSNVIGHVVVDTAPTTAVTIASLPSGAVTNAGTFAVQVNPVTTSTNATTAAVKLTVTSSVNVKASAGNVYGVSASNGAAAICWVQFINSATAGTLGSGVVFSVALPASGVVTVPPGAMALSNFSTGIAVGIASATNSSTACGTAGNLTVFYN